MKNLETKQLKIRKKDWQRLEQIRITLANQTKIILSKMDTISLLLDMQIKNNEMRDEK